MSLLLLRKEDQKKLFELLEKAGPRFLEVLGFILCGLGVEPLTRNKPCTVNVPRLQPT